LRALRSDLINPAIAVHRGRVAKRTGDWPPRRISQRGRCGALRTRSAARHRRAQRTPSLIDSPPDFREAMIKAGLPESERRCGVPAPRLRSWRRRYAFERPKYNSYVHRCSWRCLLHVDSRRIQASRLRNYRTFAGGLANGRVRPEARIPVRAWYGRDAQMSGPSYPKQADRGWHLG
jgi:hypothetical protein